MRVMCVQTTTVHVLICLVKLQWAFYVLILYSCVSDRIVADLLGPRICSNVCSRCRFCTHSGQAQTNPIVIPLQPCQVNLQQDDIGNTAKIWQLTTTRNLCTKSSFFENVARRFGRGLCCTSLAFLCLASLLSVLTPDSTV